MPNRILKESICTSDNLDALSPLAEVFFYRLLVQCDDYGRMDARPAILRARCFPLRLDTVENRHIETWLAELMAAHLIAIYRNGGVYLQVLTWDRHQQIRAKRSKFPEMQGADIIGYQMISNGDICPRNPIQSESESESESNISATVVAQPTAPTPKRAKSAQTTEQQDMFGAVATVCVLSPKLKAVEIGKTATSLLKAGFTVEQVLAFREWWAADEWRASHTPTPTMRQLLEKIQQSVTVPPVNGRPMSKSDRTMAAIDRVFDQLEAQEVSTYADVEIAS